MGRQKVKVAVDTDVLIRAVVRDDPMQATAAIEVLTQAKLIAIALPFLCEFVWVLLKVYRFEPADAITAIRVLISTSNVQTNAVLEPHWHIEIISAYALVSADFMFC